LADRALNPGSLAAALPNEFGDPKNPNPAVLRAALPTKVGGPKNLTIARAQDWQTARPRDRRTACK